MNRLQSRVALLIGMVMLLVLAANGTLFAAGTQLRHSVVAGGGTVSSSSGYTLRSVAGQPVADTVSAMNGYTLCPGFHCGTGSSSSGGDSGSGDNGSDGGGSSSSKKLYLPNLQNAGP